MEDLTMKINSLYVSVKDRDRAKDFYQNIIFECEPSLETDRFVFFNIDGFLFGLFDPIVTGEKVQYGNNTVPTIEVNEIESLYKRLTTVGLKTILPLQEVNGTRIFQVEDTENNILEFYQWI
jgi:predicted enzyme related to lactoylglutathione lyase